MNTLNSLKNTSKYRKNRKRVGRGTGSGMGKTSGRGHKGQKSRSGAVRRYGYEGGQFPLHMKLPIRGFSNARFKKEFSTINLKEIEKLFEDGDNVNIESLKEKGLFKNNKNPLKILGDGELKKKVTIEADAYTQSAKEKLQKAKINFSIKNKG